MNAEKSWKYYKIVTFESAFGIRDFLQEIMCEEGDSRVDVMWLNAWKTKDFKDCGVMGERFCRDEIMWKLE